MHVSDVACTAALGYEGAPRQEQREGVCKEGSPLGGRAAQDPVQGCVGEDFGVGGGGEVRGSECCADLVEGVRRGGTGCNHGGGGVEAGCVLALCGEVLREDAVAAAQVEELVCGGLLGFGWRR